MKKQSGYTAIELLFAMVTLATLGICGVTFWVIYHFLTKFW